MRPGNACNRNQNDGAIASLTEYLMVSAVLLALMVIMLLLVNTNIMENPANRLIYVQFTDIGNGVSTRIVDVYSLAPDNGTMTSRFDIPDEIVGRGYNVELGADYTSAAQDVRVWRDSIQSLTAIGGVAASKGTFGNTTGAGLNIIYYNSEGM